MSNRLGNGNLAMNATGGRARRRAVLWLTAAAWLAGGCESAVQGGLTETEANRIVVALQAEHIGARKEPEAGGGQEASWQVVVPSDEVGVALQVLRANNLPREQDPGFQEVFGAGSMVPTATEERARWIAAVSGELARSLEAIDGVLDARVHIALPDEREFLLDEQRPKPRASVLLKYEGKQPPYDPAAVQQLVAGAVQGLDPAQVAVVGVPAPASARPTAPPLVHVGPIAVTRGSATILKAVLGGALAIFVLMALAMLWLLARRNRQPPAAAAPTEGVPPTLEGGGP